LEGPALLHPMPARLTNDLGFGVVAFTDPLHIRSERRTRYQRAG